MAITAAIVTGLLTVVGLRTALRSGLRGFFALGLGMAHLSVWSSLYAWKGDVGSVTFASTGFAVVGSVLVVGGGFQMALMHEAVFKRYTRETTLFQRYVGRSPRFLPAFSIDFRWLLWGIANAALAMIGALVFPSQFLLVWGITVVGAFMMLSSTGAFSKT